MRRTVMKATIGSLLCVVAFCFLTMSQLSAQDKILPPDKISPRHAITLTPAAQPLLSRMTPFTITGKKASGYTAQDWGRVIDSTWGSGQSATDQLNVFDAFWSTVDQQWAGFPNLPLNWDSVRNVYRSQIGSGLSRGRFYALMSRIWLALMEYHTFIYDAKVDTIFGTRTWHYKSGVPLVCIGTGSWDLIGAPVTPTPDSSGLVYRVAPANPLGLKPGDLILGYEGIPWKRLYGQLLNNGVPVSRYNSSSGSTPESMTHEILSAVGWNWGMFSTIDVVKYSTGDTLHLSTAPLSTATSTLWATDQVPVAGVPMPPEDNSGSEAVSWGVVQGTNIGYIYAWDWGSRQTASLFSQAVYDLRHNKNVNGLVIDFRTNWGGEPSYADPGLSQLFNFDPTAKMSFATHNSLADDHFAFTISSTWTFIPTYNVTPTAYPFDRPIAVLIGPACLSAGDWNAFRMRFHPMARLFGKPTNGAFVGGTYAAGTIPDAWHYQMPTSIVYSNVAGEGYLIHKGVQPDEQVWLTRDGVAKGEDDVVKRALAWIMSLSYAHDVKTSKDTLRSSSDSVTVTARVENPGSHTVFVSAIVTIAQGTQVDSLVLLNDGLHGDGAAGDSIWGAIVRPPAVDGKYNVSVRTDDKTTGDCRRLPNAAWFNRSVTDVKHIAGDLPQTYALDQNYPNPFNPSTTIKFKLPKSSIVRLSVYDMLGREVSVLVNERREAGVHEVKFDVSNLASGVYFYRIQAGDFTQTKRLLLLR
jgi:hypothetical protein